MREKAATELWLCVGALATSLPRELLPRQSLSSPFIDFRGAARRVAAARDSRSLLLSALLGEIIHRGNPCGLLCWSQPAVVKRELALGGERGLRLFKRLASPEHSELLTDRIDEGRQLQALRPGPQVAVRKMLPIGPALIESSPCTRCGGWVIVMLCRRCPRSRSAISAWFASTHT